MKLRIIINMKGAFFMKNKLAEFFKLMNTYDELEYLVSVILCNAIATLKKEKVASLISFTNRNKNLNTIWEKYNSEIQTKLNIKFYELKKDKDATVVLFYNEEMLENSLKDHANINFLKRFGYDESMGIEQSLLLLSERFSTSCPHEIGIFLGYPIEDVETFVDCPNAECKLCGYWKVYHNVENAKNIFSRYDALKFNVIEKIVNGSKPLEVVCSC